MAQAGNQSKDLARLDEPVLAALQQAIEHIDEQVASTVQVDPASQEAFKCITSVPGLGLICGSLLVMLFGRLQTRSADAVIAFTGVDPRPNDSGGKGACPRGAGLSTIAALVVLARKLLRLAFSLFKQQALFDPALIAGRA